jgi:hypothetical protein
MPRDEVLVSKDLDVLAISTYQGEEYPYSVRLDFVTAGYSKTLNYKWVLIIEGTPGQWFMSTLMERVGKSGLQESIWIDMGRRWKCINFREVLEAALEEI